ncbi:hypothetical protein ACVW1A_004907 [Bradyrhizobium sp. LB1.3]
MSGLASSLLLAEMPSRRRRIGRMGPCGRGGIVLRIELGDEDRGNDRRGRRAGMLLFRTRLEMERGLGPVVKAFVVGALDVC